MRSASYLQSSALDSSLKISNATGFIRSPAENNWTGHDSLTAIYRWYLHGSPSLLCYLHLPYAANFIPFAWSPTYFFDGEVPPLLPMQVL